MGAVLISSKLHDCPLVWSLPRNALWSWVESICWLSRNDRADKFPKSIATLEFDTKEEDASALLRQGMWQDVGRHFAVPQSVSTGYGGMRLWKFADSRPFIPRWLRLAVYERDGMACLHCQGRDDLTLDHIHPFSLGGPDTFENLQTLCRSCNSRKGARI